MTVNCKGCGYLKGKCTYDGKCQNKQVMEECYQQGRADERVEVKNCDGCKHKGKWEYEIKYGYPSPCTTCSRGCVDNYEAE